MYRPIGTVSSLGKFTSPNNYRYNIDLLDNDTDKEVNVTSVFKTIMFNIRFEFYKFTAGLGSEVLLLFSFLK